MSTRVVTESTPSEAPEAWQSEASTVRHRAAAFWLDILFWTARVMPWLPKLTLPFWVNMTWVCSPALRQATLANAGRLAPTRARRCI